MAGPVSGGASVLTVKELLQTPGAAAGPSRRRRTGGFLPDAWVCLLPDACAVQDRVKRAEPDGRCPVDIIAAVLRDCQPCPAVAAGQANLLTELAVRKGYL